MSDDTAPSVPPAPVDATEPASVAAVADASPVAVTTSSLVESMEKALGLPEGQTVQVFEVEAGKYTCQAGDTLFEFTLHDLQAAETPLACIKQRYAAAQAAKGR